jgi:hypothetical protein
VLCNEELYNTLVEVFGEVIVHTHGQPITLSQLPSMKGRFGANRKDFRITTEMVEDGGEHYSVDCPFCGDTRKRLWLSHAWGSTYEIDGKEIPISRGLICCFNENCTDKGDNFNKFCSYLEGKLRPTVVPKATLNTSGALIPVDFPEPTYEVTAVGADPVITRYLLDRKYDLAELNNEWGFRYGKIDFYDVNAVIMPVFDNYGRQCAFWQARYPIIGPIPETFRDGRKKPKYYLPAGSKKSLVLYNLYRAMKTDFIVLTEGIFDAVRVGPSGVAMFGKDLSTRQMQDLYASANHTTLVWIPDMDDPDALGIAEDKVSIMNLRNQFAGGAHVLRLEKGDPADHTRSELWASINALTAR